MKRLTLSYGVESGPRRTLSLPLGRANLVFGLLGAATVWSAVTAASLAAGVLHWGDAPATSLANLGARSVSVAGVGAVAGAAAASIAGSEVAQVSSGSMGSASATPDAAGGLRDQVGASPRLDAAAPGKDVGERMDAGSGIRAGTDTPASVAATSVLSEVGGDAVDRRGGAKGATTIAGAASLAAAAGAALTNLSPLPAPPAAAPAQPLPAGRIAVATAAAGDAGALSAPSERLGDADTKLDGTAPGAQLAAALVAFRAAHVGQQLAVQFVIENHGRAPIAGSVDGEADFHDADGHIETVKATVTYKARQLSPKQLTFNWPAAGGEFTSVRLVLHDKASGRLLKAAYPLGTL